MVGKGQPAAEQEAGCRSAGVPEPGAAGRSALI